MKHKIMIKYRGYYISLIIDSRYPGLIEVYDYRKGYRGKKFIGILTGTDILKLIRRRLK